MSAPSTPQVAGTPLNGWTTNSTVNKAYSVSIVPSTRANFELRIYGSGSGFNSNTPSTVVSTTFSNESGCKAFYGSSAWEYVNALYDYIQLPVHIEPQNSSGTISARYTVVLPYNGSNKTHTFNLSATVDMQGGHAITVTLSSLENNQTKDVTLPSALLLNEAYYVKVITPDTSSGSTEVDFWNNTQRIAGSEVTNQFQPNPRIEGTKNCLVQGDEGLYKNRRTTTDGTDYALEYPGFFKIQPTVVGTFKAEYQDRYLISYVGTSAYGERAKNINFTGACTNSGAPGSDYGIRVRNGDGDIRMDTTDRVLRFFASYSGTLSGLSFVNISVPGFVDDGTWIYDFVDVGGIADNLIIFPGTDQIKLANYNPGGTSSSYSIKVFRV
jgi:hypothetical protein